MDVDSRQPEATEAEAEAEADAAGVQHHKTKGGRKVKMVTRCKRNPLTTKRCCTFKVLAVRTS